MDESRKRELEEAKVHAKSMACKYKHQVANTRLLLRALEDQHKAYLDEYEKADAELWEEHVKHVPVGSSGVKKKKANINLTVEQLRAVAEQLGLNLGEVD